MIGPIAHQNFKFERKTEERKKFTARMKPGHFILSKAVSSFEMLANFLSVEFDDETFKRAEKGGKTQRELNRQLSKK